VVSVQASDAVGVTQIRYVTTGGLAVSGSRTISPPATSTSTSFSITVPYNASDPDVTLRAYARDAAGNEGASVTVDIRVTSADITPPATVVTSVSNPGSGSNATVYYQVTSGLEDLDHVELYFRRNGIGTFNRFTDADSGNSLGEYTPQSGSTGTILFKSTKMGGDGVYQFFTVGIDKAGNREAPPNDGAKTIIGDTGATATFNTGAEVVEITTIQEISSTTYDNRNLRINGAQIVLVGSHSFKNVELTNGAVLKHRETTLSEEPALPLTVWTLSIDSTSSINVDTLGYLGGRRGANSSYDQGRTRSETETNILGSTAYSGGAYGGTAGRTSGAPNQPYGSIVDPVDLGSGGGCGSYGRAGGNGGGRVDLHAVNGMCDGAISSNG